MKAVHGSILRVIDGDTVIVAVRCRLAGLKAPELSTAAGQKAKAELKAAWPNRSTIAFRAIGGDAYNRMLIAPE